MRYWILLLGLLGPLSWGDTFEGKVSRVLDGDTIEVKDGKGKRHLFRLLGADAPQEGQNGYWSSRSELRGHVMGKRVTVDWFRAQVCPPTGGACEQLAKVFLRGEDLALRQIRRGWAWHDKRRLREQSTTDKTLYADAELHSRLARRGLWAQKKPVPPWRFKPVPKKKKKSQRK